MDNKDVIIGLFALAGLIVWIVQTVVNQRNFVALTSALKEANSDPNLIDQLHALATDVVPADLLHKALDSLNTFATFAKTIAPDDVDQAIDAADSLVSSVVNDTPNVKSIPITPIVPRGEDRELAQQ